MKKKFLLLGASLLAAVALASCDGTKPQEEPIVENGDNGTEDNNQGTGDDNQNTGDNNQGTGDDNQGTGDENQGNGDDNQGNGDENQGTGDDNQGTGDDNQGNGDDNQGTGDDNQGNGDENQGTGDDNQGTGDENQGTGDENQGTGDNNQGTGDENQGTGDENQGTGDENQGTGDENQGNGDDNQGNGDENQGTGDENQGTGDNNQGTGDENQGTGDENQGTGDNNQGTGNEEEPVVNYEFHEGKQATYTEKGVKPYYTVKTENGTLYFDENKNPVLSDSELSIPVLSSSYEVKEIREDGSLVLNVTRYDFVTRYNGRYLFAVTIGDKTYEVALPKWVEEIKEGHPYLDLDGYVTIVLKDGNFNEVASALVADEVTMVVTNTKFDTLIPAFNYLDSTDPVYVFGKDIEVTIDDAQIEEYIKLSEEVLAEAQALVAPEGYDYSLTDVEEFKKFDSKYMEWVDAFYEVVRNYKYASILADATAEAEAIKLETKIMTLYYAFREYDERIDIAMAASVYRYLYFEGYDDEKIDALIARLNPEQTAEGNAYQTAMKEALAKQETGEATPYQALVEYVGYATKYANLNNYDDYMAYAYENVYGRDYQYADTDTLKDLIAQYIVPINAASYNKIMNVKQSVVNKKENVSEWNAFVDMLYDYYGGYFDYLEDYSKEIGGQYEENFKSYFLDGYYFYSNIPNDNVTGYVSAILGHPMMFLGSTNQELSTFIHEFGHYNAHATGGDDGGYDLSETQSQGNEMLFYTYLTKQDSIPSLTTELYLNMQITNMTDTIIEGYLINEIEKYLYTTNLEELTEEKLLAKWTEICAAAGFDTINPSWLYSVLCNYNCYYISYCTSAIAALELYAKGVADWDLAIESYKSIYAQHPADATFTSVLEDAGLYGVYTKDAYDLIASAFSDWFTPSGNNQGNGGEEQPVVNYVFHEGKPATYTEEGNKPYYTVKTENGTLYFDEDKNPIEDTSLLSTPILSSTYEVKEIKEDGSLVLNVTRYDFVTRYNGRFLLTVTIGENTYEVALPKWVEEIKDGQSYFALDDYVTITLKNGNFNEVASSLVGDEITVLVKDVKFETLIPVFNYLNNTDPIYLFGQDIEVTLDDEKIEEYKNLCQEVLAEAQALVAPEGYDYSLADEEEFKKFDSKYMEWVDAFYDVARNNRYASILADATAKAEAINLENKIMTLYYAFCEYDERIDIAMAASVYRYLYFEGYDDEKIDALIARLNPEQTAEGNAYQNLMNEALAKQKTGEATAYQALVEYIGYATKYANLNNYDDYLAYAYENVYSRDYQYGDTDSLATLIGQYIVPINDAAYNEYYTFYVESSNEDWHEFKGLCNNFYGYYFDYFESYADEIGGNYKDNFKDYFLDGYYFYSNVPNNNITGYVGKLLGQPIMFLGAKYQGANTFIHEFGHYNAKVTGGDNGGYDLSETQSQGNEMLFYTYLAKQDSIGKSASAAFLNYRVYKMTSSIIEGYLINEIEKYLYTANLEELTEKNVLDKWNEICVNAGMTGYVGEKVLASVFNILCNYKGYYISYCTSAVAALELYAKGLQDWNGAIASYTTIYEKHADDVTFTSVLEDAGLYGVFTKEAYELIATAFPNVTFVVNATATDSTPVEAE